jgi:hypothetical protein
LEFKPGIQECSTLFNTVNGLFTEMKKNCDYVSSEKKKYYDTIANGVNQKNAVFLKGCESLTEAVMKLGDSGAGNFTFKEILNTHVFKDFQYALSAQNKVNELLNKSDETRSVIRSGFEAVSEQLSEIAESLESLEKYMYDFTNLDTTHVFLPHLISPFAQTVVEMQSVLRGETNSISHEEFANLEKQLSDTTTDKNGFMKVIQTIFQKFPDVKDDISKNSTMKKFISKLEPGRKRGRPKGSTSKKKNAKKQKN